METEKIKLGSEEFEVEVRPITVIVKAPNIVQDIEPSGRFVISPEQTMAHARWVTQLQPDTEKLWRYVFRDSTTSFGAEESRAWGIGAQHALGLIDLSLILHDAEVPFMWRYPEAHLHPSAQLQLGDVLVWFMHRHSHKQPSLEW